MWGPPGETTSRGAESVLEPTEYDGGEDGVLRKAAVRTYGDVIHSFVDRSDYHGPFMPGYRKVSEAAAVAAGLSLLEVDHCVGNVELGQMNRYVDYYRDVFGFSQLIHYDDKVIHTDYSALMSKVMTNGNGRVKFPINEPASGRKNRSSITTARLRYLSLRGCRTSTTRPSRTDGARCDVQVSTVWASTAACQRHRAGLRPAARGHTT